jgi:hypothetical protein
VRGEGRDRRKGDRVREEMETVRIEGDRVKGEKRGRVRG